MTRIVLWGLWAASMVALSACQRPPTPRGLSAEPSPVHAADPLPAPTQPPFPAGGEARESPPSPGRTYFVAPHGDDANPGTREAPWQHPAVGAARLRPGDTLILLPGTYVLGDYETDVLRPPSGAPEAWITIQGDPQGPYPRLLGEGNLAMALDLAGVQYLRLEHLEITHNPQASDLRFRDGVAVLGAPAAHLIFRDLYIHHLDEFGMDLQDVEDLLIEDTRIAYAGFGALGGPAGAQGGWQQVTIRRTELTYSGHYYQGGDGSQRPYDRPDGLGIEPSAGPIVLEEVVAAHNYGDGLDSKAAHTLIRNAVVANNACDGVKLWGAQGHLENVLIYGRGDGNPTPTPWAAIVIDTQIADAAFTFLHLTVDDALGQNYLLYAQYDHPEIPVHLTWRNLIFSSRGPEAPIYLAPEVHLEAQGALFFFPHSQAPLQWGERRYGCAELATLGEGLTCGDPAFIAPAWGQTGDYRLSPTSPARDAGFPAGVSHDLLGRPRDAHPDLGAYEGGP